MALFRTAGFQDIDLPLLQGDGVFLRAPQMDDFFIWARLRDTSRAFLQPWEPVWAADELTRSAFRRRLKQYAQDVREDFAYPFFIFRNGDNTLLGGLTLAYIRRGISQSAHLGYWIGQPFAGQGHMSRAVRAMLPFAFSTLKLHRLEAACLPHNLASSRVLERAGFVREGLARNYLCINGTWQDHLLYGMLREDAGYDRA